MDAEGGKRGFLVFRAEKADFSTSGRNINCFITFLKLYSEYYSVSFSIKIDGIDKAIAEIEKIRKSLYLEDLDFWCKRISNDVKLRAQNDLGERFKLEVALNEKQNPKFDLSFPPELTEIVTDTIRSYLIEMPITTRGLFEEVIKTIQKGKKEEKA